MIRFLLFIATLFAVLPSAEAHEVRPAYLEATEIAEGQFDVVWREPVIAGRTLALDPVFPEVCVQSAPQISVENASQVTRFQVECDLRAGRIDIEGLAFTLTDVFLRVRYIDGETTSALLRPGAPGVDLSEGAALSLWAYFPIGVEHIWFGPDHLLFVFGLVLLVPYRRLLWVITAFTIAHSLTLGLAALQLVTVPGRPVEILIAMSIALLAVEVVRKLQGEEPSLALRYPWAISFAIGLVHGLGFAGALADIGLPKGAESGALALFNLGVEAGQVVFVFVLLGLFWCISKVAKAALPYLGRLSAYFIGSVGVFWTLERVLAY